MEKLLCFFIKRLQICTPYIFPFRPLFCGWKFADTPERQPKDSVPGTDKNQKNDNERTYRSSTDNSPASALFQQKM